MSQKSGFRTCGARGVTPARGKAGALPEADATEGRAAAPAGITRYRASVRCTVLPCTNAVHGRDGMGRGGLGDREGLKAALRALDNIPTAQPGKPGGRGRSRQPSAAGRTLTAAGPGWDRREPASFNRYPGPFACTCADALSGCGPNDVPLGILAPPRTIGPA